MGFRTVGVCICLLMTLPTQAQTSPPEQAAAKEPAAPTESDRKKAADEEKRPAQAKRGGRSANYQPPPPIRLQEGGVKMPKCAEESREGEACRQ
jgi:hypothetical protein